MNLHNYGVAVRVLFPWLIRGGGGLSRELRMDSGGKPAQTRFPIADNFFTYRGLIVDTHQDGK